MKSRPLYALVSGYHDYRTKRKVDLHFIADELKRKGDVFFLSIRYSYLTRRREDPRHDLWTRANQLEVVNDVTCLLWRTLIHPFRLPRFAKIFENVLFSLFARRLPRDAIDVLRHADIVLVESGIGIIYIPLIKKLNPNCKIVYLASDSLDAINQADYIKRKLSKIGGSINWIRVPSPYLWTEMPRDVPIYFVPHGIDKQQFAAHTVSPFIKGTINAVSIGSMLFDRNFVAVAANLFPDVTFHVIGCGLDEKTEANVIYYPEMAFSDTLPYLHYADIAIAAYGEGVSQYLTHTSMKLMQYQFVGVPAVCPMEVAGSSDLRFGYARGDRESIRSAIRSALECDRTSSVVHLSWDEVTDRLLNPTDFKDTTLISA